jgi:sorbitol/mannitol transport system permease protein
MTTAVGTTPPSPPRPPAPARKKTGPRAWATRAPLLPALVFLVVVTQLPFVATLVISLFDWNSLNPDKRAFNGLDNYASVFTDAALRDSVLTTILLTAGVVIATVVLGLALALLLDRTFFGRGMVRTLLITPFLIVPVSAALLWKHALYNPEYGLLNGALSWLGELFGDTSPSQPDWIADMPLLAVIAALVWQWTPFMMLILLAGLQSRPTTGTSPSRTRRARCAASAQIPRTRGPARRRLHRAELRRRVHDHRRRTRHRQPALHDLPDLLPGPRIRTGVRRGSRGGDRHDHHRHLRAPDRLVPLQ